MKKMVQYMIMQLDDIISSLTNVAFAYYDDEKDNYASASIEAYRLTLQITTDDDKSANSKNNTNVSIGIKLYYLYTNQN